MVFCHPPTNPSSSKAPSTDRSIAARMDVEVTTGEGPVGPGDVRGGTLG